MFDDIVMPDCPNCKTKAHVKVDDSTWKYVCSTCKAEFLPVKIDKDPTTVAGLAYAALQSILVDKRTGERTKKRVKAALVVMDEGIEAIMTSLYVAGAISALSVITDEQLTVIRMVTIAKAKGLLDLESMFKADSPTDGHVH